MGVLASGFSNPDTPSDIGCVQEGTAYGGDVGYRLVSLFPREPSGQAHLGSKICNEAGDFDKKN